MFVCLFFFLLLGIACSCPFWLLSGKLSLKGDGLCLRCLHLHQQESVTSADESWLQLLPTYALQGGPGDSLLSQLDADRMNWYVTIVGSEGEGPLNIWTTVSWEGYSYSQRFTGERRHWKASSFALLSLRRSNFQNGTFERLQKRGLCLFLEISYHIAPPLQLRPNSMSPAGVGLHSSCRLFAPTRRALSPPL